MFWKTLTITFKNGRHYGNPLWSEYTLISSSLSLIHPDGQTETEDLAMEVCLWPFNLYTLLIKECPIYRTGTSRFVISRKKCTLVIVFWPVQQKNQKPSSAPVMLISEATAGCPKIWLSYWDFFLHLVSLSGTAHIAIQASASTEIGPSPVKFLRRLLDLLYWKVCRLLSGSRK